MNLGGNTTCHGESTYQMEQSLQALGMRGYREEGRAREVGVVGTRAHGHKDDHQGVRMEESQRSVGVWTSWHEGEQPQRP